MLTIENIDKFNYRSNDTIIRYESSEFNFKHNNPNELLSAYYEFIVLNDISNTPSFKSAVMGHIKLHLIPLHDVGPYKIEWMPTFGINNEFWIRSFNLRTSSSFGSWIHDILLTKW